MRVAFITHYPNLYGANRSLLNLIDGLRDYGVQSYIIVPCKGEITPVLKERKIPFAIVPIEYWIDTEKDRRNFLQTYYKAAKRFRKNLRAIPRLEKQLKEWEINVVYTNASVTPAGALIAKKLRLPHVWHLREFIDLDYGFKLDWGKFSLRFLLGQTDAIVANSNAVRSYFLKGFPPEKVNVIYNGIERSSEFDRWRAIRHSLQDNNKPYTFAIVGLIQPGKGQETAIRAFSLLVKDFPDTRLLIVGGSGKHNGLPYLKQLVEELNIANQIEFWGHIDDPYQAYLESDALLMCSKNEAMGRVTVEAMSVCLPVIGYDNAGTSELIQHDRTGLLYQNGYEELAACMRRFVENSSWAKQLGENAWQIARQQYCIEVYAQKVYRVLLSVTKERK